MTEAFDLKAAFAHCTANEEELRISGLCGCFYCEKTFVPSAIVAWIDDAEGQTAHCPLCEIDSVIGDASAYPVSDAEFLNAMNEHWFGQIVPLTALEGERN
jgi:hypothetical protein